MESMAAMLIVLFQLFFGWCGSGEPAQAPAGHNAVSQR
jgi:hypothetical protein